MSFPVADLTAFRAGGASTQAEADSTVAALVKYGCMLVKTDVRVLGSRVLVIAEPKNRSSSPTIRSALRLTSLESS